MWFKVDDGFCMNPKTAMLSNDATALWLRSGTWAAQQLTKGRVPANMIPMFRCSDDSVQELCDAGLWEYDADKDEYVFHDVSEACQINDLDHSRLCLFQGSESYFRKIWD